MEQTFLSCVIIDNDWSYVPQSSDNPQQANLRKNHEEVNVCVYYCSAYGGNYAFCRRVRVCGKLLQILQELL